MESYDVVFIREGVHAGGALPEDFQRQNVTARDMLSARLMAMDAKPGYRVHMVVGVGHETEDEVGARYRANEKILEPMKL